MRIVSQNSKVKLASLKAATEKQFGHLIKAVVDTERGLMVLGGELHADEEALLLRRGSRQEDLWGINLYPNIKDEGWIEFDSMINLRPSRGNLTRGVDNPEIKKKITEIVNKLVER